MLFQIDWASLVVGRKFTVFALFYFVFEGNFQLQAPPEGGAYIWGGDLTNILATIDLLASGASLIWPRSGRTRATKSREVFVTRHMKCDEGLSLFNGGFFALRVWGAYIWRGLFSGFYCIFRLSFHICISCVLNREVQRYEIQSIAALRTPRHYGQFALSSGKESPYIFSKFTPLIQTLCMSSQCLY